MPPVFMPLMPCSTPSHKTFWKGRWPSLKATGFHSVESKMTLSPMDTRMARPITEPGRLTASPALPTRDSVYLRPKAASRPRWRGDGFLRPKRLDDLVALDHEQDAEDSQTTGQAEPPTKTARRREHRIKLVKSRPLRGIDQFRDVVARRAGRGRRGGRLLDGVGLLVVTSSGVERCSGRSGAAARRGTGATAAAGRRGCKPTARRAGSHA